MSEAPTNFQILVVSLLLMLLAVAVAWWGAQMRRNAAAPAEPSVGELMARDLDEARKRRFVAVALAEEYAAEASMLERRIARLRLDLDRINEQEAGASPPGSTNQEAQHAEG